MASKNDFASTLNLRERMTIMDRAEALAMQEKARHDRCYFVYQTSQ